MDSARTVEEKIDAEERRIRASRPFKEAVKLIDPSTERTAECELRLLQAVAVITLAERIDNLPTPAKMRNILADRVEMLRKIEDDALHGGAFREQVRRERERIEELTKHKVPAGSRRPSGAKFTAVRFAHDLLADFATRASGLTRGGDWHELALILFGNTKADLFDYMRAFDSLPEPPCDDGMLVPERIADLLVR